MLQSEFEALKSGDKVVFNKVYNFDFQDLESGAVLTRQEGWLDDNSTVRFTFTDTNGETDYHFFSADQVELIKE